MHKLRGNSQRPRQMEGPIALSRFYTAHRSSNQHQTGWSAGLLGHVGPGPPLHLELELLGLLVHAKPLQLKALCGSSFGTGPDSRPMPQRGRLLALVESPLPSLLLLQLSPQGGFSSFREFRQLPLKLPLVHLQVESVLRLQVFEPRSGIVGGNVGGEQRCEQNTGPKERTRDAKDTSHPKASVSGRRPHP